MQKPNVIRVLVALVSGDLFKRPKPSPGVPVVWDHADRRGPNRHLSEAARKAGVTCPSDWRGNPRARRRLF